MDDNELIRHLTSDNGTVVLVIAREAAKRIADLRARLAACEEALATIVTMPVDGCCPSVIESMLRQAKSLACTVLQDRGAKQPKATASDVCSTTEKKRKGGMR